MRNTKYDVRVFDRSKTEDGLTYTCDNTLGISEEVARKVYQDYCKKFSVTAGYSVLVWKCDEDVSFDATSWGTGSPMPATKQSGPPMPGDDLGCA